MSHSNIIVIAHGKSEMIMANAMKKALRLQITVFNPYDGRQDVSIGNILEVMENNGFQNEHILHKKYPVLDYRMHGKPSMPDLKIFPIMDIDSYGKNRKAYETGNMFKDCIFANRIVPIFNEPNLDEVMNELGYSIDAYDSNKISSYHDIFDSMRPDDYLDLTIRLRRIPEMTNLPLFLETCLRLKPEFQGRI